MDGGGVTFPSQSGSLGGCESGPSCFQCLALLCIGQDTGTGYRELEEGQTPFSRPPNP